MPETDIELGCCADKSDAQPGDKEGPQVIDANMNSVIHTSKKPRIRKMVANLIPYQETDYYKRCCSDAQEKCSELPEIFTALGTYELFLLSLYRALAIEFVGTAVFVYIHIAIIAACQSYTYPPLQIAIGHFFLISLFILQFSMSSGAHFNAMISFSSVITGHMPLVRGILYIIVQVLGSAVGAEIMRKSIRESTAESIQLGRCSVGDDLNVGQGLAIEFMCSITILFVVYGTAFNLRQREIYGPVLPPFLIAATISLVIFSSAALSPPPFTGAGGNPSLCLGTAWAYSSVTTGRTALRDQWIYWVGPCIASLVNGALYALAPPHHETTYHTSGDMNNAENPISHVSDPSTAHGLIDGSCTGKKCA